MYKSLVKWLLSLALVLVPLAWAPAAAQASPIYYTYTGIATGSLAGNAFSNVGFVITGAADTSAIGPWCCSLYQNTHTGATISLTGIGAGTFLIATHTWIAENCCMGFGKDLGTNLLTLDGPGLTDIGYALNTALGPVLAAVASTQGQFVNVATSLGILTITDVSRVSFQASSVNPSAVPEPATLALLATGLVTVAYRRSRKPGPGTSLNRS